MNLYKLETKQIGKRNRDLTILRYKEYEEVRRAFSQAIAIGRKNKHLEGSRVCEELRRVVNLHRERFNECIQSPLTVRIISRKDRGALIRRELYQPETYREAIESIKEELRQVREARRAGRGWGLPNRLDRNGNPYHAGTPNRVFSILCRKRLSINKKPKDDQEYVGIELECITPAGADFSKLAPFHEYVNVGTDGSIDCNGNETGSEIRVCIPRAKVREIVPQITEALRSLGARVNRSCGLHVHLDQRNAQNVELNYQKLVRAQSLLYTVVPLSRRENNYCKRSRQYDFRAAADGNRYHAINASAYHRYRTLEVRLFGGTLSGSKVVNWIETLYAIVEGSPSLRCPKNFDIAKRYWKLSDENVAWLKERALQFAELNSAPVAESDASEPAPVVVTPQGRERVRPRTAREVQREETLRRAYGAGRRAGARTLQEAASVLSANHIRDAVNQLREANARIETVPTPPPAPVDPVSWTSDHTTLNVDAGQVERDTSHLFYSLYDNVLNQQVAELDNRVYQALAQGEVGRIDGVNFVESQNENTEEPF